MLKTFKDSHMLVCYCDKTFLYITSSLQSKSFPKSISLSEELLEDTLKLSKDLINRLEAINLAHFTLLVVKFDDRHRLVLKGSKALAKGLDIVIISTASLGALLNAVNHGVLISIKEDAEGHINRGAKDTVPAVEVVLIAREPVDQKALLVPSLLLHALLQQLACNLNWNNFALNDALVDQSSSFRS